MNAGPEDGSLAPPADIWEAPESEAESSRALSTPLDSLVYMRDALPAEVTLEQAHRAFGEWKVAYIPIVGPGRRLVGLSSRAEIGHVLGSRFGFSLFSGARAEESLVVNPLVVTTETPVAEVIERALGRQGEAFNQDVVLTDGAGVVIGLIRVETLAQLQSRIVKEQMDALQRQQERMRERNLELFQANHALRQSQGLYLALFENHALGVALLDVHGKIAAHNKRFDELLRCTRGGGLADGGALERVVAEKDRARFSRGLEACQRGRPLTEEFTLLVPGGGARLFRCSMGWVRETGQICVCLDDITEQRALARQVALRDKQTLLESLVGGIAHELNNKLTPVQGFAELLEGQASPAMRSYPRLITQSVSEATRIVKQLRELAAPGTVETRRADLRALVDEALAMMRFHFRDATCERRIEVSEEPVWVQVDGGQIKQVIINLVLNALDAMRGRAGAVLTVRVSAVDAQARLQVVDTGVGIPPENLMRIFDPFFTTKGPDKGTGLGLSICFSIVRQYGGEIAVESEPEKGATFTVVLPIDARVETAVLFPEPLDPAGARAGWRRPKRVPRVLVVDDEEVLRLLLQEQFRVCFGCHVDMAQNGAEALAITERESYDLIVTDVLMPVMTGRDFHAKLAERAPELARRVVFLTGYAGDPAGDDHLGETTLPVIRKPFSKTELVDACRPFLETVEAADARTT